MLIRKLHKNNKWPLWVIVIVILITVFYKYHNYLNHINRNNNNFSKTNYTEIEGKIEKINKISYTEYYLKNYELNILLKNYPKNIDNLIGNNVIINGEIKNIGNDKYFFVKSLKDLDNNILVNNNIYTFTDNLIIFNVKEMPRIVPYKEGNKIIIYYKNNPLMYISTFGCSKISTYRNCKDMIDNFELNENDYFNSYNGLIYYKIDKNKRSLFNDLLLGYYFDKENDDTLLNISSIIEIINSDYIRDNKKDLLSKTCKDLFSIDDVNIIGKDGNILNVTAKGKDKEKKQSECKVGFDLMNERKIIETN